MAGKSAQASSNDSASWALVAALIFAVGGVELGSPMPVHAGSLLGLLMACTVLGAAALFYTHVRANERFSACCIGLSQALVFSAAGALFSYLLARTAYPLCDSRLHAVDQALGLNWIAYARFVDTRPWLLPIYSLAYQSLIPQTIVIILALGFDGKLDQLRQFVFAAILSGIVSIVLAAMFPAIGTFAYLGLHKHDFAHVWQSTGLADLKDFLAMRSGGLAVLDLTKMQGIITFPSYHGALAVLSLWSFWISGRRWLRWSGATIALLTLVATPIEGGHYFTDVFAGILIALASIAAARHAVFLRVPFPALTAWPFRRSREAFAR